MVDILTEQNATASRALIRPGDIYLRPDLAGISAADFGKFREGAAGAHRRRPDLRGDLRIGVALEAGNARNRFTETRGRGWQQAAIYFGGETPVGPLFLGYGYARGGHSSLYLFIGLP